MTNPSSAPEKVCATCKTSFYEAREEPSELCSKCEGKIRNKKALRLVFWVIIGGNLAVVLVLLFFYMVSR